MGTLIGPQRHEFWATHTINAFHGAPLCLGIWMSKKVLQHHLIYSVLHRCNPPNFPRQVLGDLTDGVGGEHGGELCPRVYELSR